MLTLGGMRYVITLKKKTARASAVEAGKEGGEGGAHWDNKEDRVSSTPLTVGICHTIGATREVFHRKR